MEGGASKLKVYLHVYDGKREKCPKVSKIDSFPIIKYDFKYLNLEIVTSWFFGNSTFNFQYFGMEIGLGVFGFLLLLGIVTILAILGLYRLNDARAYAK